MSNSTVSPYFGGNGFFIFLSPSIVENNDTHIINGNVERNESGRYDNNSIQYDYNCVYEAVYKNVVMSNQKQVPNSGVISLKIRFSVYPADPRYFDYYTSASIHFNGTTSASVYFGGWEYGLNIDDLKK